jgi:putative SOS response-associated peptidase YedK
MFLIEQINQPIMLIASVSKLRLTQEGKPKVNTSVITLPPHEAFLDIHHKSFPLILNQDELEHWLDPRVPLAEFNYLLEMTTFRDNFIATEVNSQCEPINKPSIQFKGKA